jgi:uncharacterized membrane protein YjfL (UPF0719 family)
MQVFFSDVGLTIAWSLIGVMLLFVATLVFDKLHPLKIDEMIRQGNVAAGVLLGAVVIGLAIIIASVIG